MSSAPLPVHRLGGCYDGAGSLQTKGSISALGGLLGARGVVSVFTALLLGGPVFFSRL